MDVEYEIIRLRKWNHFWISCAILTVAAAVAVWQFSKLNATMDALKLSRNLDNVHLSSLNDGPYVVTHVADYNRKTSARVEPIAIIDSAGGSLSLKGLTWYDLNGEVTNSPGPDAVLRAFYYRPEVARDRAELAN